MRIERIAMLVVCGWAACTSAFEPGSERVCKPSADGQSFECRDKTTGEMDAPPANQDGATLPMANPAIVSPSAAPAREATLKEPEAAPAPSANDRDPTAQSPRKLPGYLMQRPQTTDSETVAVPAPAPFANGAPKAAAMPAPKPVARPEPAKPTTVQSSVVPAAPVKASASTPPAKPQQPSQLAAKPPVAPVTRPATSESANIAPRKVSDAAAFRALPAGHYTIVLASVRNPAALDALALALAELPGTLYRLKLSMPDGDWYSLCWSQFADVEAARAARSRLPTDAGVTSGWPRKIGLLQQEIAR